jgi:SAM-dependent methyltransferase
VNWTYAESDPAMMLFTAAVDRFGMTFPPGATILELGCAETNWLERMAQADPTFALTGVDVFPQPRERVIAGDACNPNLFAPDTFDRIVLLGALEHFGLGFYGDPIYESDARGPYGDIQAMVNVAHWLKPGGCVYFDVPCNPRGRIQENRHFRQYAPSEVATRLLYPGGLQEIARGYSEPEPHAGRWVDEPTTERVPYWFVAVWAQKPHADH